LRISSRYCLMTCRYPVNSKIQRKGAKNAKNKMYCLLMTNDLESRPVKAMPYLSFQQEKTLR
jgi:hypothetical protein